LFVLLKKTLLSLLLGSALAIGAQAQAESVLRIVPQSDLKILDPIWTTAFITRDYGYAVYDTLFGVDMKGNVQPQMVGEYKSSDDGKVWTFTLRDGLAFHDGKPVTSEDVIPSVKRWGARDALGQRMMAALDSFTAKDDKTFVMTFKTPFPLVLQALSKPSSNPPFIMPKASAETPADQQVKGTIGSGPFIFKADEYRPGERIVFLKNTKYVPRKEPADGTAGGKVVNVDRMEWVVQNDPQTAANALANGEVDMIEFMPPEQYKALAENPKITLDNQVPAGSYALHLNRLVPPFNNTKIAQAAFMAINQEALMRAGMNHKELYNANTSVYPSGSPYHDTAHTSYFTGKPQFEKAKALLKEAGYKGEPIVLMNPSTFPVLNKFPSVMAALLRQAGFTVDLQSMDWPTLVTRRVLKTPADQGGWNAFITGWFYADNFNPVYYAPMTGNGEKGWFGWTSDEKLESLKADFMAATSDADRKKVASAIQERVYEAAVFAPIGEYKPLTAFRKDAVSGLIKAPVNVFWGLKKN
jgi:peptide/nickel transport system substrate-binding protein